MSADQQLPPQPPPPPPTGPPPASPPPPSGTGTVSPNRTIMIVLSYLWILALIPLLLEKDDAEVQWHAKHGLVLTAAEFVLYLVLFALNVATAFILDIFGCFFSIFGFILWIAIVILHIVCIVKGTKGERLIIPGISEYANRF